MDFNNDVDKSTLGEDGNSVAENKVHIVNADIEAENFNIPEKVTAEEEYHELRYEIIEKGLSSQSSCEVDKGYGITINEDEIQEYKELNPEKLTQLATEEYDLERILEEQEIYDLYCPNCRSCITKRVILRKRKRTCGEIQSDLLPEMIKHDPEGRYAPTEEVDHKDETVFRCLSCFSFFIPTESGFNIFHMFGKKDGSNNLQSSEDVPGKKDGRNNLQSSEAVPGKKDGSINLQSSEEVREEKDGSINLQSSEEVREEKDRSINLQSSKEVPAKNLNWVLSLFGSGSTKHKGTETEVPLLAEYNTVASRDLSSGLKETSTPVPTIEATDPGVEENNIGINNEDPSAGEYFNGVQVVNSAQQNKPSYAAIESKDLLISNDALTGNVEQGEMQDALSTTVQNVPSSGASSSNDVLVLSYPAATISEGIFSSNENISGSVLPDTGNIPSGNDSTKFVSSIPSTPPMMSIQSNQNVHGSETASNAAETVIDLGVQGIESSRYDLDSLKSIVYGGLLESITSLSVVSSAAGAGSSTSHVCAMGLANLVGGLFLILHDLLDLREHYDDEEQSNPQASQYWKKLGKREHFPRHAFISILSYIIFGSVPPIIYGFTFRGSNNKEYKIITMASSSLFIIALLAIGKANTRKKKDYLKQLFYYLAIALPASGLAFVAGVMINRLFKELGWFDFYITSPSPPSSVELMRFGSGSAEWQAL